MSSDRKAPIAAAAALVAALVLTALAALPAAADSPVTGPAASAGRKIADALRTSPVYVDPAYAGALPAARQKELARRIGRTGLPIEVALVPLVKGDAFDGDPAVLADIVHERSGLHDLIVVTMAEWGDGLYGHEWPGEEHQARDAVAAVEFLDSMKDAGLADRADKAVDLIAEGDGSKVYQDATADLHSGVTPATERAASSGGSALWPVLAGVAAGVVVLAAGGTWLVRRRRAPSPFVFPQAVFAAARTADLGELRHRAQAQVIALGEAIENAEVKATPGLGRALDAYAAAGKVLDTAREIPDLAGVLALVVEGRDALDGRAGALPLCFFDPLHGRAARRVSWRPLGRRDQLDVAVCAACGQAVRARRAPETLTDSGPGGHPVPYYELPPGHSPWADTGYGSLLRPGDADTLADRVLRGNRAL
ncbi:MULTISPECIES: hypothetical protein [unclassified Streptomyces]|uniref:hypothetical protein n=1 Tax=unclassified Streptomyces TaxID=2593676 RepID=UPI002E2D095C|nr:hypothetical protein [Streptomyces sp. NBC_00223]